MSKYILITGGVCSSLGKGVASAAIGSLLECSGLKIAMMKCDPYINVDAGNMNPYQHGEVYVTADGAETDLNLGNYARFANVELSSLNSITTGKIYDEVIKNERSGRYNGRAVQVIPHITDEIKRRIMIVGAKTEADVVIVEIGGTVGDIESIPFLEAARQLIREKGKENALCIHLTLVPIITGGELKTKPTQHSVKNMQQLGIQPDILLCRTEIPLEEDIRKKIASFCNVEKESVFTSIDVEKSIYELPVEFHRQGLDANILSKLGWTGRKTDISAWNRFIKKLKNPKGRVCVAMLGKKTFLDDCYKSVREALLHAAISSHGLELEIRKIDAETLESCTDIRPYFKDITGIIVPDNYGQRGFLGLLQAIRYAREQKIPFLGIGLGMQLMAIETARHLLGWEDSDSTEFVQNSSYPVISLPEEQAGLTAAGVMRLGDGAINIQSDSQLAKIYGKPLVIERHRSKYTFDRKYSENMQSQNLIISAYSKTDNQVEAFEWKNHPWGIGVQFHPEFISRPAHPHPLFSAFIGAAAKGL
ncbi:CTP synthase [Treponema sp. OMZ 840]|uniref:CTP synthase n=1 Tax=Treponema sp. OMZ 840 TaxID=244313 RepID=UPI003D8DCD93